MKADTHAALVNLANTIGPNDDIDEIIDELRAELIARYGFAIDCLKEAFTEACRRFWERERRGPSFHSVDVRHLTVVTEPEFRDMSYPEGAA